MRILVLNGPNLNLLGIREKALYGARTYRELESYIRNAAAEMDVSVEIRQSNHEGVLVDWIQEALGQFDGIVINPAAYTHTSIAILDALQAVSLPCAEVHLTDIAAREDFRKISYAGLYCQGHFIGQGFEGYKNALAFLKNSIEP